MLQLKFGEWLSKDQPNYNPFDNNTNSDYNFGSTGARSKYAAPNADPKKTNNPKKMFGKNKRSKDDIIS